MARPKLPRDEHGKIVRDDAPVSAKTSEHVESDSIDDGPATETTASFGLLETLPVAAQAARDVAPHGTEADLLAIHLRLSEIKTMLPADLRLAGEAEGGLAILASLL